MEDFDTEIDFNKLSLFTTPLGKVVQMEYCDMLLGKKSAQTERASYVDKINDSLSDITQRFRYIDLSIKLI